jgi:hypothetical protein
MRRPTPRTTVIIAALAFGIAGLALFDPAGLRPWGGERGRGTAAGAAYAIADNERNRLALSNRTSADVSAALPADDSPQPGTLS